MCESSSRASRDWPRVSDIFFLKKEAIDLRDKFRGKGKQKPVFFFTAGGYKTTKDPDFK